MAGHFTEEEIRQLCGREVDLRCHHWQVPFVPTKRLSPNMTVDNTMTLVYFPILFPFPFPFPHRTARHSFFLPLSITN